MENTTKLYWLTRLDNINGLFITLVIVSILAIFLGTLFHNLEKSLENEEETKKRWGILRPYLKSAVISLIVSTLGILFLPTKNELIFIYAGGKTIDFIQQDSSISKIPGQTTKIISDFMQKQIDDLKKEK